MSCTHWKVYSPHNEVFGEVSPSKGDWLDDTVVWGRDAGCSEGLDARSLGHAWFKLSTRVRRGGTRALASTDVEQR